ncbi:hypothetical protein BGZ68_007403 [Mortierella alpina]|nr:hypothetical protein BGZ68_007403 [Mortierella alpina]
MTADAPKKKKKAALTPDQQELPETQLRKLDLCWSGPRFRSRSDEEEFDSRELCSCDGDWGDEKWDEAALFLIGKSPHLVDLSFNLASFNHTEITFGTDVPALKRLKIAGFREASMYSETFTQFFDALPSQLEELTLDCDVFFSRDERDSDGDGAAADDHKQVRKAIRVLVLRGNMLEIPLPMLTRFLKQCPLLTELRLTGDMYSVKTQQVAEVLRKCCPELDRLVVQGVNHTIDDHGLARLLTPVPSLPDRSTTSSPVALPAASQSARWKSVELVAPYFGPRAASSLLVHAPTLEHVSIRHGGLPAHDLHTLLATAPNLRTLTVLSDRAPQTLPYCLKGAPPSWACAGSLEVLRINTAPGQWKVSARNNLLQQIGSMPTLRVLHFRNASKTQQGFCDFSLQSGTLDRLKGLKELEEFQLESFQHKIASEEQSWIKTHWSRLKKLLLRN